MVQTNLTELLDIVDANDQVTGVATRAEIHARGLLHRSVHVLVFNSDRSVLLQKRSMQKDQCAGMWDSSCAGHVESGQSYQETAPRELLEELGFSPAESLKFLFKMQPSRDNGQEFAMVYATEYEGPFTAAEDEIDELRWFSCGQVDEWIKNLSLNDTQDLTSGFIEIWNRFREANA